VTTHSTDLTKGYTDTWLSFQIFLISRSKFSYFVIFCASVLGRLCVKGTAITITSSILFSLSMRSVEIYHFISYDRPVPILSSVS
jgi:hypothetical protein